MWWATVGRALSYGVSISHKSDLDKTLGPSDSDPRLTPYGGRRAQGEIWRQWIGARPSAKDHCLTAGKDRHDFRRDEAMSQEVEILRRLETGVTLTPIEALADPDIRSFRLAARIDVLRKAGHDIETVQVHTGTGKTVAGYRLKRIIQKSGQVLLTI